MGALCDLLSTGAVSSVKMASFVEIVDTQVKDDALAPLLEATGQIERLAVLPSDEHRDVASAIGLVDPAPDASFLHIRDELQASDPHGRWHPVEVAFVGGDQPVYGYGHRRSMSVWKVISRPPIDQRVSWPYPGAPGATG